MASIGGQPTTAFLFRKIFSRFGLPHSLLFDQGAEFCNKAVCSLNELFMVRHRLATRTTRRPMG